MKTTIKNSRNILFASFMLLASAGASFGNNDKNKNDNRKDSAPVEFRFVGSIQQQPVYQLDINNTNVDEYYISFSDGFGTILYSGNIKSGLTSQRFMINADEVGDEVLTVTITARKANVSQVYTIKRSQNLVEENVVKRVK